MDSRTAAMQRFPTKTLGYIVRDSTSAYRFGTFKMFLNLIKKIEKEGFFKMNYAMGFGKPIIVKKDGKKIEYADSFVRVYLGRSDRTLDIITFFTVRKYADFEATLVKPNSKNSREYKIVKKSYSMYRRM